MIYLDNAATTRMSEAAAQELLRASVEDYANTESLHSFGFSAMMKTEKAREILAAKAGVKAEELYFTPSGTMADNTAISGYLKTKRGGRVITSAFEHPAVAECIKQWETAFDVVHLTPDKNGVISPEALREALTSDTVLVSIMHVNNETGAIQDLAALSQVIRKSGCGAVFHTDAVQGFMKEPFAYRNVDMASFSAHKTHGPKGLGALYVKKGIKLKPVYVGGGHEKGLFSGTVNAPAVMAWAKAVENTDVSADREAVRALNTACRKGLEELGLRTVSPDNGSPYILNAILPGYISENVIHALAAKDIAVSSGSACSAKHPGAVYRALGLDAFAKNALRISFSADNTCEEIALFLGALNDTLSHLIKK